MGRDGEHSAPGMWAKLPHSRGSLVQPALLSDGSGTFCCGLKLGGDGGLAVTPQVQLPGGRGCPFKPVTL